MKMWKEGKRKTMNQHNKRKPMWTPYQEQHNQEDPEGTLKRSFLQKFVLTCEPQAPHLEPHGQHLPPQSTPHSHYTLQSAPKLAPHAPQSVPHAPQSAPYAPLAQQSAEHSLHLVPHALQSGAPGSYSLTPCHRLPQNLLLWNMGIYRKGAALVSLSLGWVSPGVGLGWLRLVGWVEKLKLPGLDCFEVLGGVGGLKNGRVVQNEISKKHVEVIQTNWAIAERYQKLYDNNHCRMSDCEERTITVGKSVTEPTYSESLNVKKIHNLYCEKGYPSVSYEFYRSVFTTRFNISFGYPRSDSCGTCNKHRTDVKILQEELSVVASGEDKRSIERKLQNVEIQSAHRDTYFGMWESDVIAPVNTPQHLRESLQKRKFLMPAHLNECKQNPTYTKSTGQNRAGKASRQTPARRYQPTVLCHKQPDQNMDWRLTVCQQFRNCDGWMSLYCRAFDGLMSLQYRACDGWMSPLCLACDDWMTLRYRPATGCRYDARPAADGCRYDAGPAMVGCRFNAGHAKAGCHYDAGLATAGCRYDAGPTMAECGYYTRPVTAGCCYYSGPATDGCRYHSGPATAGCRYDDGPATAECTHFAIDEWSKALVWRPKVLQFDLAPIRWYSEFYEKERPYRPISESIWQSNKAHVTDGRTTNRTRATPVLPAANSKTNMVALLVSKATTNVGNM
ncbi:hypothetical protein PR048_005276 [Dryococelus australis]|uniref:Uncharacterized protein n=1 Tax=Dryococelus australis TaxID=614101 RepID=A0ABQ9I7N7_9NEOP|nr:hypothetical protein PR048_005276 [Dryococelus australis]